MPHSTSLPRLTSCVDYLHELQSISFTFACLFNTYRLRNFFFFLGGFAQTIAAEIGEHG